LRTAVRAIALTCLSIACLALPFYLHAPRHFGPLESADRPLVFHHPLPYLGTVLIAATAALAVALSLTRLDAAALFRNCAIVQAFPIAAGAKTIRDGRVNLTYARYGAFVAWFVFMAFALSARRAGAVAADGRPMIVR
jgi:hypothetical protein